MVRDVSLIIAFCHDDARRAETTRKPTGAWPTHPTHNHLNLDYCTTTRTPRPTTTPPRRQHALAMPTATKSATLFNPELTQAAVRLAATLATRGERRTVTVRTQPRSSNEAKKAACGAGMKNAEPNSRADFTSMCRQSPRQPEEQVRPVCGTYPVFRPVDLLLGASPFELSAPVPVASSGAASDGGCGLCGVWDFCEACEEEEQLLLLRKTRDSSGEAGVHWKAEITAVCASIGRSRLSR